MKTKTKKFVKENYIVLAPFAIALLSTTLVVRHIKAHDLWLLKKGLLENLPDDETILIVTKTGKRFWIVTDGLIKKSV